MNNILYDNDYNNGLYDSPDIDLIDYNGEDDYNSYDDIAMTDDDLHQGY
jgi:hypothetical protein